MSELWARYGRVSTDAQQGDKFQALSRQLDELKWTFEDNDWELNEELLFTDIQSGWDDNEENREGFSSLLQAIREKKVTGVVVTRLDRIAREVEVLARILKFFKKHHVKLYEIEVEKILDYEKDWKYFMNTSVAAEEESRKIGSRVKRAHKHARVNKKAKFRVPFGYVRGSEKIYKPDLSIYNRGTWQGKNRTSFSAAKRMVAIFIKNKGSYLKTVRQINVELDYSWSRTGFKRWIINEVLQGHIEYLNPNRVKKEKLESDRDFVLRENKKFYDQHKALISKKLWKTVRQYVEQSKSRGNPPRQCYPLTGIIFCSVCGGRMGTLTKYRKKNPEKFFVYLYCTDGKNNIKRKVKNTPGSFELPLCATKEYRTIPGNTKMIREDVAVEAVLKKLISESQKIALKLVENLTEVEPDEENLKLLDQIRQLQNFIKVSGDEAGLLRQQIKILESKLKSEHPNTYSQESLNRFARIGANPEYWQSLTREELKFHFQEFVSRVEIERDKVVEVILKV